MRYRSFAATRLAVVALSAAVLVALGGAAGIGAGPAGASHKKSHQPAKHSTKAPTSAKELTTLAKKIKSQKKATYQALFEYKNTSTNKIESITVAQEPPKSLFKATGTTFIDTGTESLTCSPTTTNSTSGSSTSGSSTSGSSTSSTTGATTTTSTTTTTAPKSKYVCYKEKGAQGSLGNLFDLFSPTTALTYFNSAEASIDARIAGYSVNFSTGTYGGLASKCVTFKIAGQSYKYCVANIGILTYSGTTKGYFELKSFSKSVPSSDFSPPPGSKIETLP
jgi:hypothetical protein